VQVEAEAVTQLLSWAKSKNIALDKISLVEDVAGNRPTVVAAKDLSTGEAILTVPQNTWVTPEAAQKSAAGQLIASLEPWLQVALLLLLEKNPPLKLMLLLLLLLLLLILQLVRSLLLLLPPLLISLMLPKMTLLLLLLPLLLLLWVTNLMLLVTWVYLLNLLNLYPCVF